jgi:hypothetical protein
MPKLDVRLATLKMARDFAGGVSYLGRRVGVGANALDAMLTEREEIPQWVFLAAVDFLLELDPDTSVPEGFPLNWRDLQAGDDAK